MSQGFPSFEHYFHPPSEVPSDVQIHPTAVVCKGASLGVGVRICQHAFVGKNAKLGDGVEIGPGAIIEGDTTIGEGTQIFSYASIGSQPQDLKFRGEDTKVVIGARNRIREYVNISLGTASGGGITSIADDNLIMVYCHIGHDTKIGNHCVLANSVALAGHIEIGDRVTFGGLSGGHQFCKFGDLTMIAAGAIVTQDVPPFCMVHGNRAKVCGLNVVGLRRVKSHALSDIKKMYRLLYNEGLALEEAIQRMTDDIGESEEKDVFTRFLKGTNRGICR